MLCDRILLIHKGKLVEERLMSPLKDELRNYSVVFEGTVALHDLTQDIESVDSRVRARFDDKAKLIEALSRLHSGRAKVVDVTSQEGSLEEYFIETIERAA